MTKETIKRIKELGIVIRASDRYGEVEVNVNQIIAALENAHEQNSILLRHLQNNPAREAGK